MPFAAPRLPALLSQGLRSHLEGQWQVGDETFETALGEQPDPAVARPPGLAFDQASVDLLGTRGVTTILGAADSVERPPQPNDYAPLPAATLTTTSGQSISLLLPMLVSGMVARPHPPIGVAAVVNAEQVTTVYELPRLPEPVARSRVAAQALPKVERGAFHCDEELVMWIDRPGSGAALARHLEPGSRSGSR